MVASFYDIRDMVISVCKGNSDAADYEEKHHFSIDVEQLNNTFKQLGIDYHAIGCNSHIESYQPFISDIHNIASYVETFERLNDVMDGYTQIAFFSVFSANDVNGPITFTGDNDEELSMEDVYKLCNDGAKLDVKLLCMILKKAPVYTIMVSRRFEPRTDSFVYDIYFKGFNEMNIYYKDMAEKKNIYKRPNPKKKKK